MERALLVLWGLGAAAAFAQQQPPLLSPEVRSDRTVVFRLRAPNAKEVFLVREGAPRLAMQKSGQDLWTITTPPLEPDIYGYSFLVDGVRVLDPVNPLMKPNLLNPQNMVHVPGAGLPWEEASVPRGVVHRHFYRSAVVGDHRDYYVYTPPGYDPRAKKTYPALYLLHGFSDDASGWTAVGRAHVILDNLIAQKKAEPMLVVMTLGYGAPEIVSPARAGIRDAALRRRNMEKFRDALFQEVIPRVEREYRVSSDRRKRAIAGLSMGGAQSLFTGLNAPERFAWVGAFSSGGMGDDYATAFPKLSAAVNSQFRLVWIACGAEDRLIEDNRKFQQWLVSKGVKFTKVETPGAHTWMVWRRYLAEFAPLLFR